MTTDFELQKITFQNENFAEHLYLLNTLLLALLNAKNRYNFTENNI